MISLSQKSKERGLLEDVCQGVRISETKGVLLMGFLEKMEPSEIEENLDAAGILERVKSCSCIYIHVVKGLVSLCTHSKEVSGQGSQIAAGGSYPLENPGTRTALCWYARIT